MGHVSPNVETSKIIVSYMYPQHKFTSSPYTHTWALSSFSAYTFFCEAKTTVNHWLILRVTGERANRRSHDTFLEAQKRREAFVFMDVIVVLNYAFSVYRSLRPQTSTPAQLFLESYGVIFTSAVHFPMALASFWIGRARGCGILSWCLLDDVSSGVSMEFKLLKSQSQQLQRAE